MEVPCGNCIGCRLRYSVEWAIRCMHEASQHSENSFVTLTYRDLPQYGSLNKKHFQDFMKRLRYEFPSKKIRYFHCGEYGDELGRPHYHALLFGIDFPDKKVYEVKGDNILYTSETLEKIWQHGFAPIGAVNFQTAAYTARYVLKKIRGDKAEAHYSRPSDDFLSTGELLPVQPEYVTMSLKPAIGREWFDKYHSEVYPHDHVIANGREHKPPKYYDELMKLIDPKLMETVKELRLLESKCRENDNTPDRMDIKAFVKEQNTKLQLIRKIE